MNPPSKFVPERKSTISVQNIKRNGSRGHSFNPLPKYACHFFGKETHRVSSAVYVPHQMRGFLVKTVYFDDWKTNNRLKVIWTHIFQLRKLSATTTASHHATTKVTLNFKRRLLTNCNLLTGICLHSQGRSSIMHFEKPFFLRLLLRCDFTIQQMTWALNLFLENVILRTYEKKAWEMCK